MIKRSLLLDLSFAGIALIVFSNLNGIVFLLFGVKAAFSSLILVFCLIIAFNLFRYKKITLPHWFYNGVVLFLLGFGSIMWLFYNGEYHRSAAYYPIFRKTAPAVILVYAVYKYTLYSADRGKLLNVYYFTAFTLFIITIMVPIGALTSIFSGSLKALIYGGARSAGLFASPNLAGMHTNYTLAFMLFFVLRSRRLSMLFLLFVPLVFYASFLTFSKATIIIAGLMTVMFFIYNSAIILKMPQIRRWRYAKAVLIIFIGVIAFFPKLQELGSNLSLKQLERLAQVGELLQGEFNETTTTDRSKLWGKCFELIAAQPIQGYGLGSFNILADIGLGSHNTYLMVWGEAGIIAIFLFLAYIFCTYYRCFFWIRDPSYRFLCMSLFVVLTVQWYGSAHTGLGNSEANCILGIIFGTIESQRGKIEHLRHGKYVGKDYQGKLAKQNGHLLPNE